MNPRVTFDRAALKAAQADVLIGIDEAGRGALAGPVVAGAVSLPAPFYKSVTTQLGADADAINDSKKLTPRQREAIMVQMEHLQEAGQLALSWGEASVEEIERDNILGATRLAMARALEALGPQPLFRNQHLLLQVQETGLPRGTHRPAASSALPRNALVLIDGRPLKPFPYTHEAIVHGDSQSFAIAAASIVAKVTRDRKLLAIGKTYPQYGFEHHKGYGTATHREAICRHGPSFVHRAGFLQKILKPKN